MVRQLIVLYYTRGKQLIMISVIILDESRSLDVSNNFLFYFAHVMVRPRSSARLPGRIRPGKFGKSVEIVLTMWKYVSGSLGSQKW